MVGIVLVSHSRPLALAVQELVRSMTGTALPLAIAAGAGEKHLELGTDAFEISEAILSVKSGEGVLVLMDMGSAILSSETALDLLDEEARQNIRFCAAPFVEGAVAAGVTAHLGASLRDVYAEAMAALKQKQASLSEEEPSEQDGGASLPTSPRAPSADGALQSVRLTVRNPHGLHSRPAARLIRETRPFEADLLVRNLTNGRGPVSLKSLSSLACLEILFDHEIEVSASGRDASAALRKVGELVESGLGEELVPAQTIRKPSSEVLEKDSDAIPISPGLAIGPLFHLEDSSYEIPEEKIEEAASELERLRKAVASVESNLETRKKEMAAKAGAASGEIYEAQILALHDPAWLHAAQHLITNDRQNAAFAWSLATRQIVDRYRSLADPYLRERGADYEDVGRQVLEALGVKRVSAPIMEKPAIVVADNLTPLQVSSLDQNLVLGVIVLEGGPTSHSSILLKALGLPAIVQARSVFTGHPLLVAFDGASGKIWIDPSPEILQDLQNRQQSQRRQVAREREAAALEGSTLDGHRVQIFANLGSVAEANAAVQAGAEGVGLLRTEFLFLDRSSAPDEEEQFAALREIVEKMGPRPVIVRTLDVGGDKEVPYLQMPAESNPFLGVRALRLCLTHEPLFMAQLRAILRAGYQREVKIMFPMIADLHDLIRARQLLERAHAALQAEDVPHIWPIEVGIMIEIPSAALQAASLAEQVDFFSIGTNDLTQYTLAADRGNPALAAYQDALHPAVLTLIDHVVQCAKKRGRLVAVCGEVASDEIGAAFLVGLGIEELSVSAASIPRLKASLRQRKFPELQQLAAQALHCQTASEVRDLLAI